ncbi:MAG: hydroxylamine reductase [Promethearchaeota archaeon]
MFCYQCQEAAGGTGCTTAGVCGKKANVANMQYAAINTAKAVAFWNTKARNLNKASHEASHFIIRTLFATITNANFDEEWFFKRVLEGLALRDDLQKIVGEDSIDDPLPAVTHWKVDSATVTMEQMEEFGHAHDPLAEPIEDIRSLKELIIYGLKGLAAYLDHASVLGFEDESLFAFLEETLAKTLQSNLSLEDWLGVVLKTGEVGVQGMAILDKANTETFGKPEPTKVNIGVKSGPSILISGHDLLDLYDLLEQTKGTDINIYTHGEMLPAHGYPKLKAYPNLVGNYGGAWWQQKKEFESFNGPVLLTTNCLVPPKVSYKDRVFTTGNVGFPGLTHIPDRKPGQQKDFSGLIAKAKECASPTQLEEGTVNVGYAHDTVLGAADQIVDAVKQGLIKRFIVMAGCDGRMKSRGYYTDVAQNLPKDTIILTSGCAKFRFNKLDLGMIGGFPRVLDAGQCNDSYSLAVIALKLAEVFGTESVNELPLSFDISWYEQKAVIVLLALLYLGVKKIRLGPTLPAFLSQNVVDVLVKNFDLMPISTVTGDIEAMMKGE